MKFRNLVVGFAVVVVVVAGVAACWRFLWSPDGDGLFSQRRGEVVRSAEYELSGPYVHDNLSVFLIHGRETLDGRSILTLQEALEQKKAIVHETGDVNQLAIENLTDDQVIYVQSGDVVKGGQQDRTFPSDALVGPKSGRVPIDSFCVESGRWARRGNESLTLFDASESMAPASVKRQAVSSGKAGQAGVWQSVEQTQARLSKKLGESAQADESKSSLQLTLERPAVRKAIEPFVRALGPVVETKGDVIGFVVAVNGRVILADVYASRDLFRKLWPKLLEGAAVEAFIESDSATAAMASESDVRAFLLEAEGAAPKDEATNERTCVQTRQGKETMLQESCDRSRKNLVLHRSFMRR
jgi:hypothetical protein